MSRYFVPISIKELKQKIESLCTDDDLYRHFTPALEKDLSKVCFDYENFDCGQDKLTGFHLLPNNLAIFAFMAGGDWESPVWCCIYWDGTKLRGYIPEDGNLWNTDTKTAYGNDEKADLKNARKRWPENNDLIDLYGWFDDYDIKTMKQDIMKRIVNKAFAKPKKK